jgi:transposase
MCTRPSKNYPPELRERAIRMVAEIRPEYTSAHCARWPSNFGIGSPQSLMNWVRKAQVDAGQRAAVTSAEAAELRRLGLVGAGFDPLKDVGSSWRLWHRSPAG